MSDRGLPDFTDPNAIGLGQPNGAPGQAPAGQEPQEIDAEQVNCSDGWVVEMRALPLAENAGAGGAIVGLAVHSSQVVLAQALLEAQTKFEGLVEGGQIPTPDEGSGIEMGPMPLGPVTDAAGNEIQIAAGPDEE